MSAVVSIIVAMTPDGAIGRNGDLLYHISADLKRFKAVTMGKSIVMGRKTFESLPGALPGRRNIVITHNSSYTAKGAEIAASFEDALAMTGDAEEVMVIGGAEIYRLARNVAGRVYLTLIDAKVDGADTFIATFDEETWAVEEESDLLTDPRSGVSYKFLNLVRRQ